MKIQFISQNEGYEKVIELLKENHPEYKIEITEDIRYTSSSSPIFAVKIGNNFLESETPEGLYEKIVDHFFKIPNCFIG